MVRKDEINAMMESQFDELKNVFIGETKEILISSIKEELKTLFTEELAKFKEEVYKKMDEITSTNKMLQQYVTSLKRSNEDLIKKCEENEQYGRRLCLRIKGIPRREKERSDEVLEQVRKLFGEAEVTIPDAVLDRAHRVSKSNHDVIVRFTTFRHRTLFYRKCKTLKGKSVHLDLTKSRLKLLNDAKNLICSRSDIAFCYADINCRCKVRYSDGKELFFESISDLEDILDDNENKCLFFNVYIYYIYFCCIYLILQAYFFLLS